MRPLSLLILVLATFLPGASWAQDGLLSVKVVSLPAGIPLEGVRVDLFVAQRLQPPSVLTDSAGNWSFDLSQAARPGESEVTVTMRLHKERFRTVDWVRRCKTGEPSGCDAATVEMEPLAGSSVLSQDEKNWLDQLVSNTGNALFLMPYEHLSGDEGAGFSQKLLAISLDRAITTQIQSLEHGEAGGPGLDPLPPISMISVPLTEIEVSPNNLEKLRIIGEHVQALAVISGVAFAPSAQQVEVSSNFLIIADENSQVRQRQRVDDRGLPTPLNPFDLEARLSPSWGYNTVLALGLREYKLAMANRETERLLRVYRYLLAARADASEHDGIEVKDLNTLIARIEEALTL